MTKTKIATLVTCTALALSSVACVAPEDPPELPPVGTMKADIGVLDRAPAEAKNGAKAAADYSNFANAWVRVNILRAYAVGICAIPAAAMALALTQDPTHTGNQWTWSLTIGQTTGDLQLTYGLVDGYDVGFFVTNPDEGLDHYLWIEGAADAALSAGHWIGHSVDRPAGADEVLEIDWTYNSDSDRSLAFSNVDEASEDLGDVITYTVSGTTATVVFDDASDPDLVATAVWNTETGAGYLQVPGYNGGEPACWDEAFLNVPCE